MPVGAEWNACWNRRRACSNATELRSRSLTSRRITTRRALGQRRPVQGRLHQVRRTGDVEEFEHGQVPARRGRVEVPPFGHRRPIVVADEAEERTADEIVHRPTGQLRGTGVRRLDHAVLVEAHHRVGEIVEQLAELAFRPRQLVDRAAHAPTEVPRLEQRGEDRDDRHHADGDDGQHLIERSDSTRCG